MNKVGTFGVSSAAIWWTRLFGTVGRWVLRVLGPLWNLQVVYVDDLHFILVGQDKFLVLWMALAAYELVGTPFAYHKFRGGLEVEFGGLLFVLQALLCGDLAEADFLGDVLD